MGVSMRRWMVAAVAAMAALTAPAPATMAQTNLIPGGLTAVPPTALSPNLAQNPGFEANSGGVPTGWTGGGGWAVDQQTTHSGAFSYRWSNGPSSDQPIFLKAGIYNFSAWIKTQGVGSGNAGLRLQVDFRPGGVGQWFTTDPIQGTADWTLYQIRSIVVPQDLQAALRLENFGGATGTAWFDDVVMVQQLPQPVDVFMLYPNYRGMLFDDQPQTMRFDVTVTPPGGDFGRVKIRGALKDEGTGQQLSSQDFTASANFVAQIDSSGMQAGRAYQVVFSVIDAATGGVAYTYPAYRVSKVAGSARASMNISVDAKNRLLVRGTPRFVLGVYDSGMGYGSDDVFWENLLWSDSGERHMNGLRINFYLNYWYGAAPAPQMDSLMANLQKHGVMYLQTGNCFDKFPADNEIGRAHV